MTQVNDSRPPYVEFQRRAVEDRSKTLETGVYATKDVDFIILVPHGSEGKTRIEQEYTLWLQKIKPMTGPKGFGADGHFEVASRFNPDWVSKIEFAYEKWKKGEDMDVEGTPLKNWPAISPGQMRSCLDLHIQSVEQLASAADDTIERLGMGGFSLRQRARDWLASKGDSGLKLSADLEALRASNVAKDQQLAATQEQLDALQAQVQALQAQVANQNQHVTRSRGTVG